jgi:hypothetical protein
MPKSVGGRVYLRQGAEEGGICLLPARDDRRSKYLAVGARPEIGLPGGGSRGLVLYKVKKRIMDLEKFRQAVGLRNEMAELESINSLLRDNPGASIAVDGIIEQRLPERVQLALIMYTANRYSEILKEFENL